MLGYTLSGQSNSKTLLFLHGFLGSKEDWADILSLFANRFCCLSVDLPGHGASLEISKKLFSMDGCARSIVDLLDQLKLGKVTSVGYSMGGRLALFLAANHTERIERLALISASPGLKTDAQRKERRQRDDLLASKLETVPLSEFLHDWYSQPLFASSNLSKNILSSLRQRREQSDPSGLARSLRGMGTGAQISLWQQLPALTLPTLFMAGELDEKFRDIARQMTRLCPNSKLCIIPNSGHMPHIEQPQQCFDYLNEFLR